MPTGAHLAFQAAHAAARDAVHAALDVTMLQSELSAAEIESVAVQSAAPDRRTYLMRPDLGRCLPAEAASRLAAVRGSMLIVVCDGLSATAVQRHAPTFLASILPPLRMRGPVAPVVIATQGRVALGDAIGAAVQADAVAVLIGERPGLTTPDSLGVYLTWAPKSGRMDSERNCISNIRPEGLPLDMAARKLLWLIDAMRSRKLTGVGLKDDEPTSLPRV